MTTNGDKPDLSIKPDEIDWRIGSTYEKDNQRWGMLLGYIDSRLAMEKLDLLDEHWSSRMEPIVLGDDVGVRCSLTVNGVTREDVGTASSTEPLKGAFSDALKRAAVHHGIGRELYDLPSIGVKVKIRAGGKTGAPLAIPEWRNGRWWVNPDLGWVRYEHEPKAVSTTRKAQAPQITAGEVSEASTSAAPQAVSPLKPQDDMERVLAAAGEGAEEVTLGPSAIEGVGRGGRTEGANDAQVAEFRRLVNELGWQSKVALDWVDSTLELGVEIPADGRVARSTLSGLLENMSA